MDDLVARYEQDPKDPFIEEKAFELGKIWILSLFFRDLTGLDFGSVADWAANSGFSAEGITMPQAVAGELFAAVQSNGFTFEVEGATDPIEEGGKWITVLNVSVRNEDDGTVSEVLMKVGFTNVLLKWLIGSVWVIPN